MKIAFYGGQTAGLILLNSLIAWNQKIVTVFPEDKNIASIVDLFGLPKKNKESLSNPITIKKLQNSVDLFICCHGKKILNQDFVSSIKCINFHPCLYKYKGLHPIKRLIDDNNSKASVASHWMSKNIDEGKKIVEYFTDIKNISKKCEADVYNDLYPLYIRVLHKTLVELSK